MNFQKYLECLNIFEYIILKVSDSISKTEIIYKHKKGKIRIKLNQYQNMKTKFIFSKIEKKTMKLNLYLFSRNFYLKISF